MTKAALQQARKMAAAGNPPPRKSDAAKRLVGTLSCKWNLQ